MPVEFCEGEFLATILEKFRSVLSNSMDENIYLSGILSALCSFPVINKESKLLHLTLLEPSNQFNRSDKTLIGHLKQIAKEIEYTSQHMINLDDAIDLAKASTNKYERFEVTIVKEDIDDIEYRSEKNFVEGVLVY